MPNYRNWQQEFYIDPDKNVRIINQPSDLDDGRDIPTLVDTDNRTIVTQVRNKTIDLGSMDGLNIIACIPKQKHQKNDEEGVATISRVLADRLGTEKGKSEETSFRGKNGKLNLKKFRLKVEFWSSDGQLVGSSISETITDSGDTKVGAMELQHVTPQKSSIRGGSEVCMVSVFKLADDVFPVFKVYDSDGQHCPEWESKNKGQKGIHQPDPDCIKLTKKELIIFKSPAQDPDVIEELKRTGKNIYLLFKRDSDQYESGKMGPFLYEDEEDRRNHYDHWQVENICCQEKAEITRGLQGNKRPFTSIGVGASKKDIPATTTTRDLHTPEPPVDEFRKIFEEEVKRQKIRYSGSQADSSPTDNQEYIEQMWTMNSPTEVTSALDAMLSSTSCKNRTRTDDRLPSPPSQTETKQPEQVWGAKNKLISPVQHAGLEELGGTLDDIFNICQDLLGNSNMGSAPPPPAPPPPRRNTVIIKHKQRDCVQIDGATKVESLQTLEKEEGNGAGNFLLTNFPLFVVALMVMMMMLRSLTSMTARYTVPQIKTSWILYDGENFFEQNLTYT